MTDNIYRFPVNGWRRVANRRGKHSVSCIVSDRWLQFETKAHKTEYGSAVFVDVMTDISGETRKTSRLCITLEELHKALKNYE
jgi:hypothetical protein